MTTKKDTIYAAPLQSVGQFVFNKDVADVFDDMIQRSVPGYDAIIAMTAALAGTFARPGSVIYDLGCSLGAATIAMRARVPAGCRIVAVDNSPDMLEKCKQRLLFEDGRAPVEFHCEDIRRVALHNASFVILNFTLQFIPPADRQELIRNIYNGMNEGGALVISEKIAFEDPREQELQERLHEAFKKANGYSALEIAQKRTALENVLIPETLTMHRQRLEQAGFRRISRWFQSFNFASLVAFK